MSTTKRITLNIWARSFAVVIGAMVIGAMMASGCEIHIGPGTAAGDSTDPTGGAGAPWTREARQ